MGRLISFKKLAELKKEAEGFGKTVVFTSGSFDLFHLGHARYLSKAKTLGDILVVGLPSNVSVRMTKGRSRPIIDEKARAKLLMQLEAVDYVVIFSEPTILETLKQIKPDVFFTVNEGWNKGLAQSPEAKFLVNIGTKIVRSKRQAPFLSASKMIDKAAGELIQKKFFDILEVAQKTPILTADFDPHAPENQLAAREKGFYGKVLEEVAKKGKCVFCDLKEKYLIAEQDEVVLTVALYPYEDGHLLIIPRRHMETLDDLTEKERKAVFDLAKKGKELLNKNLKIDNFWFLVREGEGIKAGKTVNHLHFHLLPYDPEVIKMGETELTIKPVDLAEKLRQ